MLSKRFRFKIHLSTLIILVIAAGAILWPNVLRRGPYYVDIGEASQFYKVKEVGWPKVYKDWIVIPKPKPPPEPAKFTGEIAGDSLGPNVASGPASLGYWPVMLINYAVALLVLVVIAVGCEYSQKLWHLENRVRSMLVVLAGAMIFLIFIRQIWPHGNSIGIFAYDSKGELLSLAKVPEREPLEVLNQEVLRVLQPFDHDIPDQNSVNFRVAEVISDFHIAKTKTSEFGKLIDENDLRLIASQYRVRREGPQFYAETRDACAQDWSILSTSMNIEDAWKALAHAIAKEVVDALTFRKNGPTSGDSDKKYRSRYVREPQ
ncbi:MAG: hypothetical protein HY291_10405 [Planctomycetes bacterium]|nr:hypothetical protein [Planctomycetota bacterium]